MTRDYKNSRSRSRSRDSDRRGNNRRKRGHTSHRTPGWVWVLTTICVAGLIALGIYLYDRNQQKQLAREAAAQQKAAEEKSANQTPAAGKAKPETAKEEEPRFDFYTLLPEQEVVIPESEIREERQRLAAKETTIYTLQAGAFASHADADSLKARLALLGIESRIESITNESGTRHKVRIGPLGNSREMNRIRNRLNSNNISTLVLREQKPQ